MNSLDPFEAAYAVTFSPDCKSARINRFGIGYGQGFWANEHFDTIETAEAAFDSYTTKIRGIYGKPGYKWTGKFIEEEIPGNTILIRGVRFIPLRKDGKKGKAVHTVHLYKIEVSAEKEAQIKKLLSVPVVD